MTSQDVLGVAELDLTSPEVLHDPFAVYARLRERSPLARLLVPGLNPMWALLRYDDAKAMLSDPRFELTCDSFAMKPNVPEHCLPYMRTMQEMEGPEHTRLRRLVAPAFTARRAAEFRPRIEPIVDSLLAELPEHVENGSVDLLRHFAQPLSIAVICELAGIPDSDRPRWREYGAHVAAGYGPGLAESVPGIIAGAKAAVAARRAEPGEDLVSQLIRAQAEDGDRLSDTELVTLIWNIVLAGQTPTNLIANGTHALFDHPEQLAALRTNPDGMPRAVEELMRWCGPQLLTIPRFPRENVEIAGVPVGKGQPVTVAIVSANRDPRAFTAADRLDLGRVAGRPHLGFAHGAHFCLGAALARTQTEVALTALLYRFPDLALAGPAQRVPDPGTWRLATLSVTL